MVQATPFDIVPVIVGTAGHVDHGKSSLVQLLTGCEMDRQPEARARGMTIDLGFAPCHLSGHRLVGIIDVPGHEDFIRNMVAGAASMDVLMLVIAADDGIMPQTREHIEIVKALRTPRVMAVVTKIDLVDDEMQELIREEVEGFLAKAGFPGAPVVLASNQTLSGIESVRTTLQCLIEEVCRPQDFRAFRMPVERVFQVKGYGTVVTGIPISGRLLPGDEVTLFPAETSHGVRSIQSYKMDAQRAQAHICAAVNLRDLDAGMVSRGMTLASSGSYRLTSFLLVHLLHQGLTGEVKRNTSVKLHAGTAAVNAVLKLIDRDTLSPGEETFARVYLKEPLLLGAGDRVLIRIQTPATTLGGGVVLTVREVRVRKNSTGLRERLQSSLTAASQGRLLEAELLAGPSVLLKGSEVLRLTQHEGAAAGEVLAAAVQAGFLFDLRGGDYLVASRVEEVEKRLAGELERYHRAHPYTWGMALDHVCRILEIDPGSGRECVRLLSRQGRMGMNHDHLAIKGFVPSLSARQIAQRERVLAAVREGGMAAPALGNLKTDLEMTEAELKLISRLLAEEGVIVRIGSNLIFTAVLEECRQALLDLFHRQTVVELAEFRQVTGAGRNLAVALLEYFDREGVTRRVDTGRVLA